MSIEYIETLEQLCRNLMRQLSIISQTCQFEAPNTEFQNLLPQCDILAEQVSKCQEKHQRAVEAVSKVSQQLRCDIVQAPQEVFGLQKQLAALRQQLQEQESWQISQSYREMGASAQLSQAQDRLRVLETQNQQMAGQSDSQPSFYQRKISSQMESSFRQTDEIEQLKLQNEGLFHINAEQNVIVQGLVADLKQQKKLVFDLKQQLKEK